MGLVLLAVFSAVAHRLGLLTADGAVAAFVVGALLYLPGPGLAPLLAFFLSASLLSKVADRVRGKEKDAKGSQRDAVQVLANGGMAAACGAAGWVTGEEAWFVAATASLCTAAADTWATDVGRLAHWTPRRVTTGSPVEVGTSGGVTLPGLLGSVVGAAIVAWSASPWLEDVWPLVAIGVVGALFDSVLGDTVQVRRLVGDRVVERGPEDAAVVSGWSWLDNDGVNYAATIFGGLLGWWTSL